MADNRQEVARDDPTQSVLNKRVEVDSQYKSVPLLEVVEKYKSERLVGKSSNAIRLLHFSEKKFSQFLGRAALLADLNNDTVGRYLTYLLNGKGSRRTAQMHQERLNSLWRFAARRGWLTTEPTLPLVSVPERTPDAWSDDDLLSLIKAAEAIPGNMVGVMANVPKSLYWSALIYFLDDGAERIGAVLEVEYADVTGEWVTVRAEGRKGKTRDKRFKLRPRTIEAIAELRRLTSPNDVKEIFHWPQCKTYLWDKFKDLLKLAELPDSRRNKFHKFRRTAASNFEAAGGNATKLLDHRNRATTAKYLDPRVIKEVMPADIVPRIGEAKPAPVATPSDTELLTKMRALLEGRA